MSTSILTLMRMSCFFFLSQLSTPMIFLTKRSFMRISSCGNGATDNVLTFFSMSENCPINFGLFVLFCFVLFFFLFFFFFFLFPFLSLFPSFSSFCFLLLYFSFLFLFKQFNLIFKLSFLLFAIN